MQRSHVALPMSGTKLPNPSLFPGWKRLPTPIDAEVFLTKWWVAAPIRLEPSLMAGGNLAPLTTHGKECPGSGDENGTPPSPELQGQGVPEVKGHSAFAGKKRDFSGSFLSAKDEWARILLYDAA